MTTATTIPVTVTDEATARIAALGMQREFEQMIEKAKEIVPHLRFIRVTLEYDPEGEELPGIVIWSHRFDRNWQGDTSTEVFGGWLVRTFPPDVCVNFCMITLFEAANGR